MALAVSTSEARITIADLLAGLGDIPPERVWLVPTPGTATEADVVRICERKEGLCELVDGTLVEKTYGARESHLAVHLMSFVGSSPGVRKRGFCMRTSGMYQFAPSLLRMPDFSYVLWERVGGKIPEVPYLKLAPDLAGEIISPNNSKAEMDRKLREDFDVGVRLVWYVYPETKTFEVFTSPGRPIVLHQDDILDGGEVFPGFSLSLKDLFEYIS